MGLDIVSKTPQEFGCRLKPFGADKKVTGRGKACPHIVMRKVFAAALSGLGNEF